MGWLLALFGAGYLLMPRREKAEFCVMTIANDNPKDRCIVGCHRTEASARREIKDVWADKKSLRTAIVPPNGTRWC